MDLGSAGSGKSGKLISGLCKFVDQRLKELDQIFAISVGGFSIMDNHLHVLLRTEEEQAKSWPALEIAKRWTRLFPPRAKDKAKGQSGVDHKSGRGLNSSMNPRRLVDLADVG